MKNLAANLYLTLALLLGSIGTSWGNNFLKGLNAYHSGDFATALSEWKPLAEQGHSPSQYNLGFMYYKGEGVPQDYETAVKWYTLAAEQGDSNAQKNLGVMFANGQEVPEDFIYAHMWVNISASNGDENGGKLRDTFTKEITAPSISAAQNLAREYVCKAYKGC